MFNNQRVICLVPPKSNVIHLHSSWPGVACSACVFNSGLVGFPMFGGLRWRVLPSKYQVSCSPAEMKLCFAVCFPCPFHFLPTLKPTPVKKTRKHVKNQSRWHKENTLEAGSAVQTGTIRSILDASIFKNQGRSRWNIMEDTCLCFFSCLQNS